MKTLDQETLRRWLGMEDLYLIDVRSPRSFDRSIAKIEKAHRIEPGKFSNLAQDLPKNRKVVLDCEDGKTECPDLARQLDRLGLKEV